MKTAVFLKNNELTFLNETILQVVIFTIVQGKVVGVENRSLEKHSMDDIVSWLNSNLISQIYLSEIDDPIHHKMKLQGIQTRTLKMLRNDQLYNTFAIVPTNKIEALKVS